MGHCTFIVARVAVLCLVLVGCGSSSGPTTAPLATIRPSASITRSPSPTLDDHLTILILGDSIGIPTMGCGTCVGFDRQYATWLEQQTGRKVEVRNEARPNAQIKDLQGVLDSEPAVQALVARADIVVVTIGYNNGPNWDPTDPCHAPEAGSDAESIRIALQYLNEACISDTLAAFQAHLDAVYGRIEALGVGRTQVRISLGVYANLDGNPGGDGTLADLSANEMASAIDQNNKIIDDWNVMDCATAMAHAFVCGDIHHAFNGPGGTESVEPLVNPNDYVHPNVAGQAKIAALLEAIDVSRVTTAR